MGHSNPSSYLNFSEPCIAPEEDPIIEIEIHILRDVWVLPVMISKGVHPLAYFDMFAQILSVSHTQVKP
jgi:hypothetical protein